MGGVADRKACGMLNLFPVPHCWELVTDIASHTLIRWSLSSHP